MAGKKIQQGRADDAAQDERIDAVEQQQQAPAPAAAGMSEASIERLKQLAQLHDQGILTDEEFDAEKKKVLAGA